MKFNLFGNKGKRSKTGFFIVKKESVSEVNEKQGNGSINDFIKSLGYHKNHIHIVNTFRSDKIDCIGFITLSKKVVFILAKSPNTKITFRDVQNEVLLIDWNYEYSGLNVEDIFNDAVALENFDFDFLNAILKLEKEDDNLYRNDQFGLYLQFDKNILTAHSSSSFDNSTTKWLTNLNPNMVERMKAEAKSYQQNDWEAIEEVNNQAKALLHIPEAVNNEFIPLHLNKYGNTNFYNLLVTHYNKNITIEEFSFMNKGRFKKINEHTLEVGKFIYKFNTTGNLEKVDFVNTKW